MTTTPDTTNSTPAPPAATFDDLVTGCGDEPMDHAAILAALAPQLDPTRWFVTVHGLGQPLG